MKVQVPTTAGLGKICNLMRLIIPLEIKLRRFFWEITKKIEYCAVAWLIMPRLPCTSCTAGHCFIQCVSLKQSLQLQQCFTTNSSKLLLLLFFITTTITIIIIIFLETRCRLKDDNINQICKSAELSWVGSQTIYLFLLKQTLRRQGDRV